MICPKDGKPCCDDLCYSGSCIYGGRTMELCPECGKIVVEAFSGLCYDCEQEFEDEWDDDHEEERG